MPLEFIEDTLMQTVYVPWEGTETRYWILNIGFSAIFLAETPVDETTITVGASIWALLRQGDSNA